jgi:hypothetical protein
MLGTLSSLLQVVPMAVAPEVLKRAKTRRIGRHRGTLRVAVDDPRSPMRRLLEATAQSSHGLAYPAYDQQWKTLWKAAKLGLIGSEDEGYGQPLTEQGRAWLADPGHR